MTNARAGIAEACSEEDERIRIDKWLWAARFFKTRSIAAHAIDAGKVLVNGTRAKPARPLRIGEELAVVTPGARYVVVVKALSVKRGPAAQAAQLYEETEQSKEARERARRERTAHPDAYIKGRPTKRIRRALYKARGQVY